MLLVKVVVVIETSNKDGSSGLFRLVADDLVIGCLVVLKLSHTGFAVFEVLICIVSFGIELQVHCNNLVIGVCQLCLSKEED